MVVLEELVGEMLVANSAESMVYHIFSQRWRSETVKPAGGICEIFVQLCVHALSGRVSHVR